MNFELSEEHQMLKDLVAKFVKNELLPLEPNILEREAKGEYANVNAEERDHLYAKAKELGLWGLDAPVECGGMDLPAQALVGVNEELGRTAIYFAFPPDSPNLQMLLAVGSDEQKKNYMEPMARGELNSSMAISEPGAGGDPRGMTTKAVLDGDEWVLNGRKIWISRVPAADFLIVMAVTDPDEKYDRISAFLVDKDTPGFEVSREIYMMAGQRTWELTFDDCRIPKENLLGERGKGFAPMQLRLTVRRLQLSAFCVGMAERALEMLVEHAKERKTFGEYLKDRQAIQWFIADAETRIHACRLMLYHAAWRNDKGEDVRQEASMIKVFATEMAQDVVDYAIQTLGAMGCTKELPLAFMAQRIRTNRILEGPSEVHRVQVAKARLRR